MEYKIKHENKIIIIIELIALLILLIMVFFLSSLPLWSFFIVIGVMIAYPFIYLFERAVGTSVIIRENDMIIKYLIRKKTIAFDEIDDVQIKRYKRRRHHHEEYRMRMTINLKCGKKTTLSDTAGAIKSVTGFLLSTPEELPDEEVKLYKIYQEIKSRL